MNNYKYGVIIQARLGSTRLPNKMLAKINGKPVIEWVVKRCQMAQVGPVIVATTDLPEDNRLAETVRELGVQVFRGEQWDVAKRYIQCAKKFGLQNIVRICGDRPLVSPRLIRDAVNLHKNGNVDLVFNHAPLMGKKWAYGFGAEVFCTNLLVKAYDLGLNDEEKEHVSLTFWKRSNSYHISSTAVPEIMQLDDIIKLDLDNIEDLQRIRFAVQEYVIDTEFEQIILNYTGKRAFDKL